MVILFYFIQSIYYEERTLRCKLYLLDSTGNYDVLPNTYIKYIVLQYNNRYAITTTYTFSIEILNVFLQIGLMRLCVFLACIVYANSLLSIVLVNCIVCSYMCSDLSLVYLF